MFKKFSLVFATAAVLAGGVAMANTPNGAKPTKEERQARHAERKAKMLEKFDANNNGVLDQAEKDAMHDQRITERFAQMDADGNGSITLAEMKAAKQAHMGKHGGKRHHRGGFNGGQK
jgi:hypothetical protein